AQFDLETAWTRIEILAELLAKPQHNLAIATTINALQPHIPSTQVFQNVVFLVLFCRRYNKVG
ncbi:MAG: hypothetical protein ACK45W_05825, partial [Pseudanabaena sp.]